MGHCDQAVLGLKGTGASESGGGGAGRWRHLRKHYFHHAPKMLHTKNCRHVVLCDEWVHGRPQEFLHKGGGKTAWTDKNDQFLSAPKARTKTLGYFARKQHMTSSFSNLSGETAPSCPPPGAYEWVASGMGKTLCEAQIIKCT